MPARRKFTTKTAVPKPMSEKQAAKKMGELLHAKVKKTKPTKPTY